MDDERGWSVAWFSEHFVGALFSSFTSATMPLCYARCVAWRLLPPFCTQVALNFLKCPRLMHQGVTFLTIASLFSSQLAIAISAFVWFRILPQLLVTLACMYKIWVFTAASAEKLRRSEENMRKELEGALISMDSLQSKVQLVHACTVGLLLTIPLENPLWKYLTE